MAWKNMDISNIKDVTEPNEEAWEYSESVTSGNGTSIIIPGGIAKVGVTIKWTSGTYKMQATTDKINVVKNDPTSVTWIDWDLGSLSASAQDEVSIAATAIRIVAAGGTSEVKVNAK
jgi:hypothetical protein